MSLATAFAPSSSSPITEATDELSAARQTLRAFYQESSPQDQTTFRTGDANGRIKAFFNGISDRLSPYDVLRMERNIGNLGEATSDVAQALLALKKHAISVYGPLESVDEAKAPKPKKYFAAVLGRDGNIDVTLHGEKDNAYFHTKRAQTDSNNVKTGAGFVPTDLRGWSDDVVKSHVQKMMKKHWGLKESVDESMIGPKASGYLRAVFVNSPIDPNLAKQNGFNTPNSEQDLRNLAMKRESFVSPIGWSNFQSVLKKVGFLTSRGYDCYLFLPAAMRQQSGFPLQGNFLRLFGPRYVRYIGTESPIQMGTFQGGQSVAMELAKIAKAPLNNPLGTAWINDRDPQPQLKQNPIVKFRPTNPTATGVPSKLRPVIESLANEAIARILEGEDPLTVYDACLSPKTLPKAQSEASKTLAEALAGFVRNDPWMKSRFNEDVTARIEQLKAQNQLDESRVQGLPKRLVDHAAKIYARKRCGVEGDGWKEMFTEDVRKQVCEELVNETYIDKDLNPSAYYKARRVENARNAENANSRADHAMAEDYHVGMLSRLQRNPQAMAAHGEASHMHSLAYMSLVQAGRESKGGVASQRAREASKRAHAIFHPRMEEI
jgi:hypothetical protein